MKYLLAVLLTACVFSGDQVLSQETEADASQMVQELDQEIDRLRGKLMRLESERSSPDSAATAGSTLSEDGGLDRYRTGNGIISRSESLPAGEPSLAAQPMGRGATEVDSLPRTIDSVNTSYQPSYESGYGGIQSTINVGQVYNSPAYVQPTYYSEPVQQTYVVNSEPMYHAPAIETTFDQQPLVTQSVPVVQYAAPIVQAPAPTIIVNIYNQQPAPQNNFFPPVLAPIYYGAPSAVAPRRGCCLFGR